MAKKSAIYLLVALVLLFISLINLPFITHVKQTIKEAVILDSLSCHGDQKDWLAEIAGYSIRNLNNANLQLSYISSAGELSTCTAGWQGVPYLSNTIRHDTVFSYASLTKVFTSELILNLVRTDRLTLDDKLVSLLPQLHDATLKDNRVSDMTISDLLSHRAGFDRAITTDPMFKSHPWCPYQIDMLADTLLDYEPNSKYIYSNVGYCLLGQIIENYYADDYIKVSQDYFSFDANKTYFLKRKFQYDSITNSGDVDEGLSKIDLLALAPVGGLVGNSIDLSKYIWAMDKQTYPNITSRPKNIICDTKKVRGCHGFSSYEYRVDDELTFYWRDGRLPNSSALAIMNSDGGVLTFLSNSEDATSWLVTHNQLVKAIYNIYLKEKHNV
ncbi:serine hydrolase domain-containing protein [Psychrobacter sp. PAMC 21119]|uniref:serine hydrolase domain-containing protein n=1 Tax=Psychrobacter sp. PAMC 21119 TaxID=1112209 RepID=UPI00028954B1|nr:serine hydrolase domain-containing protein [Psychrobacter sp. PAMC 21119]